MYDYLATSDKNDRLPVWVISYNRLDAPTLVRMAGWERLDDVYVVVRSSQWREYRRALPHLQFVGIPDDRIGSCGAARWGAFDSARQHGHDRVIMLDDDLLQFRFLYQHHFIQGPNAGAPCSRVADKSDIEALGGVALLEEATVTAFGRTASGVFDEQPNAVLGTAIKRLRSFDNKNHQTRYYLNGGATPRQWTAWELSRFEEHGLRLNMEHFGIVGEDVGTCAMIFQAGLDAFTMPSFAYDYWTHNEGAGKNKDGDAKSTIRMPGVAALLSEYEYHCLRQYDMGDNYLKVCPRGGEEYEWGEVDWRRLAKFRGSRMERVLWPADRNRQEEMETLL